MIFPDSYKKIKSILKHKEDYELLFLGELPRMTVEEVSKLKQVQYDNYFNDYKIIKSVDSYLVT